MLKKILFKIHLFFNGLFFGLKSADEIISKKASYGSGDIEINKVNKYLNLLAISGSVKINTLNIIDNSSISTTSGDVFVGNNLSNCYVEFSTISGSNHIEKSDRKSDIVLKVNTISGDIRVN